MTVTQKPTIMAIFAHPDDEAFSVGGTLTHYARKGVNVVLVCATRGEAGKITDPNMTITDLGKHREDELRRAAQALEIPEPIFLDFHDSGRFERTRHDDPKALMNVPALKLETPLRELIAQHQPQVLLCFDPHGAYGHIDHLQTQRAATAAFFSTGNLPYGGPQRLYFTAMSLERAERLAGRMAGGIAPELAGVSPSTIALTMPVHDYAPQKLAALAAHGSQMGESSVMGKMTPEERQYMQEQLIGQESYAIGGTRTALKNWPLRGLFDGIPGFENIDS